MGLLQFLEKPQHGVLRVRQAYFKIYMEKYKDSRAILRKKSRAGWTTHATEHQGFAGGRGRVGLWGVRHGDPWDGAESSRAAPHKRGLGDGAGGIRGRKDRLLNEWRWTSRRSLGKTTNLDLDLAAYARG